MLISLGDANAHLPTDKWELEELDADLVSQLEQHVLIKLADSYDVSSWTDVSNTPLLVRSLIGMYVAGHAYNRQFADEAADAGSYGSWLLSRADNVLVSLYEGIVSLVDEPQAFSRTTAEIGQFHEPKFVIGEVF